MGRHKKEENVIESAAEQVKEIVEETEEKIDPLVTATNILNGRFIHIRVGSPERTVTPSEIEEIDTQIKKLLIEKGIDCVVLTTHDAVVNDLY